MLRQIEALRNLTQSGAFPFGSLPEFRRAFQCHLSHSEVSLAEYRAEIQERIATRALGTHRLYIDTNHWTHLRDAYLLQPRDKRYVDLYDLLKDLVGRSRVVVPLSDQLFEEMCHQADPQSRRATAEVIDRLSRGVTIVRWERRKVQEVVQWVRALIDGKPVLPSSDVWASLYDAFGIHELDVSHPDKDLTVAFLKAVEDLVDCVGCSGLIGSAKHNSKAIVGWRNLADELTGLKSTTWRDQGEFEEIFEEEALSYLDKVLVDAEKGVIDELKRLPHGRELEGPWIVANAKRAFLACERLNLHPRAIPGLRVIAGGHSRLRAEQGRRFKPGDGADLFHAAAALPYCNAFLTDRSLAHLLTTPPTNLSKLYGCTVISTPDEAIDHLSTLPAP